MRLSQLLASLPPGVLTAPPALAADPEITGITADSRQVTEGSLFVAIRGETVDGQRFIPEALARGAAAIVAEDPPPHRHTPTRPSSSASASPPPHLLTSTPPYALAWLSAAFHNFPARRLIMLGVTGTDGKTTTASLLHTILLAAGLRAGLISTVSAVIGDERLDTGFHVTTPDAPAVQAYLARMVAAGLTHCVLEVTSHGLAQHRVTACEFDVAVVTNITHEHLDYHKSYENYRAAKGMLFAGLSTAAHKPGGPEKAGVLNADDSSLPYLETVLQERAYRYSLRTATADVRARAVEYKPASTAFTAVGPGFSVPVTTPLVGAYNVSNCLAALTAAVCALGLPPEAAARGLAALPGVPGRMERLDLGQPFTAIVDFAHTPNALRRTLETVRAMLPRAAGGRVIAVFGSAGLRDIEKRRLMAETSAELADLTVLTAEDPRTERLDDILEMMAEGCRRQGGVEGTTFFRVPDRGEALRLAVRLARPGDIVLACGKGHEQSMAFGATEYPWDDHTALRAALAELLGVPGPAMPLLPTSTASA
jgi:UDP-N-acetylmuramoyl-L-alanyl-D-glutamate--2,6-diaminopimelate ligase